MRNLRLRSLCTVALVCAGGTAALGHPDNYLLTITPATSSSTYTLGINALFSIGGATPSYLIGNYNATTNPTGTRTRPGFVISFNDNQPVNLTSGGVNFTAGNASSPAHPSGRLTILLNRDAGTCAVAGLTLDLLNGAPITFAPSASVGFGSFSERQPTGFVPGITTTVPLGDAQISSVVAMQQAAFNTGTLTPAGGGSYDFSVTMNIVVVSTASLAGSPFPIDPQILPVTITGNITPAGATAIAGAAASINAGETQPGPTPFDPIPFTEPAFGGNLLVNVVLASLTVNVQSTASISSSGPRSNPADVATAGTGALVPDGFLTGDDFDAFIAAFFAETLDPAGRLVADIASPGGGFTPDEFLTGDDFDAFIQAFFQG